LEDAVAVVVLLFGGLRLLLVLVEEDCGWRSLAAVGADDGEFVAAAAGALGGVTRQNNWHE
jgi:hypothetical protein